MVKRILVLDDNQDILYTIEEALAYANFEVKITSESNDVINIIGNYKPHLVILDYKQSGPKGDAICRKIKTNPALNDIPVIICTAYINDSELMTCGCDAFIAKPFGFNELMDKVNNLVHS